MDESAGASLNVDVTKFMGPNMEEEEKLLQEQRQCNDHLLLKMLEEGLNFDIILRARGGSVKAHRCVLSAASPVFKAMFEHNMKEQLSSTVDIPDMTIEGLQLFLLVLYTINEFIVITVSDGCAFEEPEREPLSWLFRAGIDKYFDEFFRALLKYQALRRRLRTLVKIALGRNLTPYNCWKYYDISLQFNSEDISTTVRDYIMHNFMAVSQSGAFLLEMRHNPERVFSILRGNFISISTASSYGLTKAVLSGQAPYDEWLSVHGSYQEDEDEDEGRGKGVP